MSEQAQSTNQDKYRVPALEKGLDILETLALTNEPQSLADLARTLNRSSSELFRMLNCLEKRHYVVRDDTSSNYQLSLKLYTLAHTYTPLEHLLRIAKEPMHNLAQTVRESCHMSLLSHGKLVVVAEAESPRRVRLSVEVGREFSVIGTTSGRLLLAHLPSDKQEGFLNGDQEFQALDIASQAKIKDQLAQIGRQVYLIAQDESHFGIKDTAILIGNAEIGLMAALTIPSLKAVNRIDDDADLLKPLQQCAQEINNALGGN